ncbi:DUF4136 domain-containing protein [Pseudomonas sp. 5P_3.1_Bac2]|uniref:DUF4136 domain-containing protein n=1 Tax=Pseudomonas sp. 5P_3.1_Bac2 TaxID=2971617 RepID=UPI0021C626BD|nr:DUF4136 domain-containing protein [Pseudomonas sp. 5P_3.1_Bac2]MCU1719376.1 DUF4136 domain-containing protein [Pseudomonas sp. 5P_3.1_Bac2]
MRALLLLPLLVLLSACQNAQLNRDYDQQRDFGAYRSWSWQSPAVQYSPNDPRLQSDLTEQRIRSAVNEQLEQRGLRQASAGAGDLRVGVWLIVDNRQEQITSQTGGSWGYPWGGYWGPGYIDTRTLDYQVGTLQVDLYDGKDGKLVWRGSREQILRAPESTPSEREANIRSSVREVLSQYPPH